MQGSSDTAVLEGGPAIAGRNSDDEGKPFSAREIRPLVQEFFAYRPAVYWLDFLASAAVAYGAAAIVIFAPNFSLIQVAAFVASSLALYRAGLFTHEIVHMRPTVMPRFQLMWNVLYGIPLLVPSLMYQSHADHHSNRYFGTPADGEYLPLGASPRREILLYLAAIPILPLLLVGRFLVLVPLSLLHPPLRRWLLLNASSLVVNPYYQRREPSATQARSWLTFDAAGFVYMAAIVGLVLTGIIEAATLFKVYLLVTGAMGLNWVRTLAAHHYTNTGRELTQLEQVLDSVNVTGQPWLTTLLFPVGLRYHALHHLFPGIPYHSLGGAHARLMEKLPADSAYRRTVCDSLWTALRQLWRDAAASGEFDAMAVWRTAQPARAVSGPD